MSRVRPAPLLLAGLWRAWVDRAAELGLSPGDEQDLHLVAGWGPFSPGQVAGVLAQLEAAARETRSAWRYELADGRLVIEADPEGRADDLAARLPALVRELRQRQRVTRDAWIAREVRQRQVEGVTIEAAAVALAVSTSTAKRALERVMKGAPMTLATGDSGPILYTKSRPRRIA